MIAPSSTGIGGVGRDTRYTQWRRAAIALGAGAPAEPPGTRLVGLAAGGLDRAEFPRAVRLYIRPIRPPPMTEDLPLVAIGQNVGPYRIDALLGWGGMGVVYRAWDPGRDRTVAIKLVAGKRSNEKTRRLLIEEARTAAELSHPSICTVHEVGHLADQPFIVMEHVDGSTLAALLANGRGLPLDDACRYAAQVIHAVAYAHDCGIVHGDLKSSNIMIARDRRAKILDFGLAIRLTNPADASDSGSTHSQDIPSG